MSNQTHVHTRPSSGTLGITGPRALPQLHKGMPVLQAVCRIVVTEAAFTTSSRNHSELLNANWD